MKDQLLAIVRKWYSVYCGESSFADDEIKRITGELADEILAAVEGQRANDQRASNYAAYMEIASEDVLAGREESADTRPVFVSIHNGMDYVPLADFISFCLEKPISEGPESFRRSTWLLRAVPKSGGMKTIVAEFPTREAAEAHLASIVRLVGLQRAPEPAPPQ